jgi:S-DNA-T family DNA segregation ATPase FtsK/SpoIIIE
MLSRRWRLDVTAFGLLAAGLLVAVSILGHDPADVPGAVYPPPLAPRNLLGPAGAWLACSLLGTLGLAAHVFVAGWFVMVALLLRRRGWLAWGQRFLGWIVLVPTAAVLADRWMLPYPRALPDGPGGSLGAWLGLCLEVGLQPYGQFLVIGGGLMVGLTLGLDFLVFPLVRITWWLARGTQPVSPRPTSPVRTVPLTTRPEDEADAAEAEQLDEPENSQSPHTIPIHHHDHPAAESGSASLPPREVTDRERFADYELPPLKLLEEARPFSVRGHDQQLRERAALLEKTFADFGLSVRVVGINTGPVITQFEIALQTGLRVHKVTRLTDDVALNLKVPSVRMVAPIPGKNTVGVEIPNEMRADVRLKEVLLASQKKIARFRLPLFLGKDAEGRPLVYDLAEMPHLLIAGTTGTGKSVCLNAIILSILVTRRPDEVKMIMIDPKGGVEMEVYSKLPHLMHPIVADMKKAEAILAWAVDKMEERYDLLRRARVRNLAGYNELKPAEILRRVAPEDEEERRRIPERMSSIVIVIDEMADLMLQMKKEVEGHIIRLAQKSRAAGIHLVVATQKPTVDVITGLIKSNLPARICFKVTNKSDSRVVLDEMGADKLLGKGDMLFLPPGTSSLVRAQCTYASDKEIQDVASFLECEPCYAPELIQLASASKDGGSLLDRVRNRDELYEPAIDIVLREGRGSVSLLQRALGIGYGRAARLIDFMAEDGIVGGYNGSSAREVLFTPEQWAQMREAQAEKSA